MKVSEVERGAKVVAWRPITGQDGTVFPIGTPGIVQSHEITIFPLVALEDGDADYMRVVQCTLGDLTIVE